MTNVRSRGQPDRMTLAAVVFVRCNRLFEALNAGSQVNILSLPGAWCEANKVHGLVD